MSENQQDSGAHAPEMFLGTREDASQGVSA